MTRGESLSSAGSTDGEGVTRLAARLDPLSESARIPGLAVVVLRDTTVILARGFGFADLERAVPATPEAPFKIASVTKPSFAVVALRLVERGPLANSDGLNWDNRLDEAAVHRSPFVAAFLEAFPLQGTGR